MLGLRQFRRSYGCPEKRSRRGGPDSGFFTFTVGNAYDGGDMKIGRIQAGAVTALLALVLAACGGSGTTQDTVAGQPSASGTTSAVRDACSVLTGEEVAAMTGEPVTVKRGDVGRTFSECGWHGARTETPYIELTVYWRGGRDAWEARRMGYGIARQMIDRAEDVKLDSIVRPGPVPGLGDSAIYADLLPAIILEDDVLVEMMAFHLPNARGAFRPLAERILERVKG
ncbi:MAG TPA: hypothetical protein VJ803_12310 [Gemmatimonadaceae bacterium]|nr:hypothetical protein [Gemmatimonadaceae bacterium]